MTDTPSDDAPDLLPEIEHAHDTILILDCGSQYTQLIARRIREARVFSIILPHTTPLSTILGYRPKGIIISGSPASVSDPDAPLLEKAMFDQSIPILGICYGMQVTAHTLGGEVDKAAQREYGRADLTIDDQSDLFKGVGDEGTCEVWMSHGDRIERMPKGFSAIAHTRNSPVAAMKCVEEGRRLFCLQFHPEVAHTPEGGTMLKNFALDICGCRPTWTMGSFAELAVRTIREQVGSRGVMCALSGGVDSSVAAALVHRAVGSQLSCVFIDNGLLRKEEAATLQKAFAAFDRLDLRMLDRSSQFLHALRGIADPERKRKIIGRQFIKSFEAEAARLTDVAYLVQGTLYPDVIESVRARGPSATIKSHHNVGGLPSRMKLKLVEPLRGLFKDEVRLLGKELGLPDEFIWRHPFPGPGLAVRILGSITPERLSILREADHIVEQEVRTQGLYQDLWQAFAVLLPVRSVGVMGDQRTYEHCIAIRAVTSVDGMTADWARVPYHVLSTISNRIINEVVGVNRVVYDISSKPPSTIEWE